mmetsp:Transcript_18429/g.28082  ORF Transcript_18429/g.28082 Transcript_18429/m.28082 type:complete len:121 (-) Transcript_18429:1316-1678(-)
MARQGREQQQPASSTVRTQPSTRHQTVLQPGIKIYPKGNTLHSTKESELNLFKTQIAENFQRDQTAKSNHNKNPTHHQQKEIPHHYNANSNGTIPTPIAQDNNPPSNNAAMLTTRAQPFR